MSKIRSHERLLSRRTVLAGMGAVTGGVTLAACGLGSESNSGSSNGSGKTTIRLAGIPAAALASFRLALEEGAFENVGLDIQYKEYAESAAVYTAYRAGEADGGVSGVSAVANLVASGLDRKVVFPFQRTVNGIMVRSDSNIDDIPGLQGKTLGLFGSAIGSSTNAFLAVCRAFYDLDPVKDCKIQYGAPDLMAQLLQNGDIDMALVIDPAGAPQAAAGEFKVLGNTGTILEENGYGDFSACWDFDAKFLADNKEAVEAFKDVCMEYQKKFNNDQALWDAAIKSSFDIDDQEVLDFIYDNQKGRLVEKWGDEEKAKTLEMLDFLSEFGEPDFLPIVPDNILA